MLRRHIQLLTLTLSFLAFFAVPRAEAVEISVSIDDFTGVAGPFGPYTPNDANLDELSMGNLVVTDAIGNGITFDAKWEATDIDLTVDALAADNAFEIFVTDFDGDWTAQLFVQAIGSSVKDITATGEYHFFYSEFGPLDFSKIDEIVLRLENASAPGDFISVDYLHAVPEPGTACMLMLGLVGLAAGSPRRRVAA